MTAVFSVTALVCFPISIHFFIYGLFSFILVDILSCTGHFIETLLGFMFVIIVYFHWNVRPGLLHCSLTEWLESCQVRNMYSVSVCSLEEGHRAVAKHKVLENVIWMMGWRGPEVKNAYCSSRGPGFSSQHSHGDHTCHSSSPSSIYWPLDTTCSKTPRHIEYI